MKPSLPQGTRDFNADVLVKRNYIFQQIKHQFELFGFEALETPAFENTETLTGKYGEEGDQLMFKILNNGLHLPEKKARAQADFEQVLAGKTTITITERALKYDLTIPFARYVAMNYGKLVFPYKRYQMQPVWRADRPQKGRYREFYQCDADIIGSVSLFNESELLQIYERVFRILSVPVSILINNRKILAALAEKCGGQHFLTDITVAIDKLDKIGLAKVIDELTGKGMDADVIKIIKEYLAIADTNHLTNEDKLTALENMLGNIELAQIGLRELKYVIENNPTVTLDVTLARGLNYYTGTIIEVKPLGVEMGSIGGGGRYDDLTGLFGLKDMSGVGISFGVDRIYDVMETLQLFPANLKTAATVLLVNFDSQFETYYRKLLFDLRNNNIACELYPDVSKYDKQKKYALQKGIPFILTFREEEMLSNQVVIHRLADNMKTTVDFPMVADFFKS